MILILFLPEIREHAGFLYVLYLWKEQTKVKFKENNVYYFQTEHYNLHQNDDMFVCKGIKIQSLM